MISLLAGCPKSSTDGSQRQQSGAYWHPGKLDSLALAERECADKASAIGAIGTTSTRQLGGVGVGEPFGQCSECACTATPSSSGGVTETCVSSPPPT